MNTTDARWTGLLGEAELRLPGYLEATSGLSHESKGIRRSELFFFFSLVAPLRPTRIIESGRARAQSTLVLSCLFPETPIVSLESDAHSPDVAVAAERLRGHENVECRFGDSLLLLPELIESGDVVLIDGPKDFRALKLAFRLLEAGKPSAVFVHDLWPGSPGRQFVDHHLPSALLSDEPAMGGTLRPTRYQQASPAGRARRRAPGLRRHDGLLRSWAGKLPPAAPSNARLRNCAIVSARLFANCCTVHHWRDRRISKWSRRKFIPLVGSMR